MKKLMLLFLCLMPSYLFALDFSMGSGLRDNEGQFLMVKHPVQKSVYLFVKDKDVYATYDHKNISLYIYFSTPNGENFSVKREMPNYEKMTDLINSYFPNYDCLSEFGIQKCK